MYPHHVKLDVSPPTSLSLSFNLPFPLAASRLLEAIDPDVDPCDDFFQYACGTWNKKNIIPDDRSHYNTFSKLRDELQVILKGQCLTTTPSVN